MTPPGDGMVLVTGASSGIGRATAILLSGQGRRLVLTGRRLDALQETAAACRGGPPPVIAPFDLADLAGVPGWLARDVVGPYAPLGGMVHAAGISIIGPLRLHTPDDFDRVLRANLGSAAALLKAFLSKKISMDGAAFVGISSVAARTALAGSALYAASKAAFESLIRSAAVEGKTRRLRINAVAPGYVATPMAAEAGSRLPGFDARLARQFLGLIEPEEVGAAVAYLLSEQSKRITGTTLLLDGGFTL